MATWHSDETESCSIRVKELFFQELGKDIEKVLLSTLKIQGILFEAIGRLCFQDDNTINATKLFFPGRDSILRRPHTGKDKKAVEGDIEAYIILGVSIVWKSDLWFGHLL